jgi:predicted DNA-binding transcriptional regulator AlpA
MTTILQLTQEDLKTEIRQCIRESIDEIRSIPILELPDRVTLDEACEITSLSKSQIYKMSMLDQIPKAHYGKRLIFSRKQLLNWMEGRTIPACSADAVMSEYLAKSAKKRRVK